MKLLIAEDDATSRTILVSLTRLWGYDPVAVDNGNDAIRIMQQENAPRLLLIDWEMPQLNGLGVCQLISLNASQNPAYIIMLTARNQTEDIVTGLEMGANDYVTKPFNRTELEARLVVGKRILTLQEALNQANEKLEFQANHDELTGLLNRRAILDAFNKEIARSQRQKQTLSIALFDIDFFKRINDSYGHLAGDHILQEVAWLIKNTLRPYDLAGRYGGEEFLIIINASKDDSFVIFERIRYAIEKHIFSFRNQKISVTISCGFTLRFSADVSSPATLINQADTALYTAKEKGRNKVVMSSSVIHF